MGVHKDAQEQVKVVFNFLTASKIIGLHMTSSASDKDPMDVPRSDEASLTS